MRAAPMDLCLPSEKTLTTRRGEAERTNSKATTAKARKRGLVSAGFDKGILNSYLLPQGASDVKVISASDQKRNRVINSTWFQTSVRL